MQLHKHWADPQRLDTQLRSHDIRFKASDTKNKSLKKLQISKCAFHISLSSWSAHSRGHFPDTSVKNCNTIRFLRFSDDEVRIYKCVSHLYLQKKSLKQTTKQILFILYWNHPWCCWKQLLQTHLGTRGYYPQKTTRRQVFQTATAKEPLHDWEQWSSGNDVVQ